MPYKKSDYFKTPRNSEKLWKYMHIDKLLSLLKYKSLYFPNIYSFNDEFEGSLTRQTKIEVNKRSLLNENTPINQKDVLDTRTDIIKTYPNEESRTGILLLYTFEVLLNVFSNHLMFCNCWFLRKEESHAMWAEYGDKSPTSIAIQTTVGNLKECLKDTNYKIHIGRINYRDYDEDYIEEYNDFKSIGLTDPDNVLKLFYAPTMYKRNIYKDEREVRAIISFESICEKELGPVYTSDIPLLSDEAFDINKYYTSSEKQKLNLTKGIRDYQSVDINTIALIQKVVISPYAKTYFKEPLKELLKYYGIDPNKVENSKIKLKF